MNTRWRSRQLLITILMVSGSLAGQQVTGVSARTKPEDYAAQVSVNAKVYAASLLPPEQVKHIFASDISKRYLVFEVACYPQGGASMEIHPDSFVVDGHDDKDVVRPADPMTIAARMQQNSTPKLPAGNTQVYTEANVGYETGTDPYSGRRVHGIYGGGGVAVGRGPDPGSTSVPPDWPRDMEALERQLEDRGLPSGRFDHAVAGYLYFPIALLKKQSKAGYSLKYIGDAADRAELTVPSKSH